MTPSTSPAISFTQPVKNPWNVFADRIEKKRRNVSCDGMPFFKSGKVSNHALLASPKDAIAFQSSAPAMIAQIAIAIMFSSAGSHLFSMRGSGITNKCSRRGLVPDVLFFMIAASDVMTYVILKQPLAIV